MAGESGQSFLIGPRKWLLYLRVAAHVALRGAADALRGRMPARKYPVFLYRALLFLRAMRHSKAVGRGGRWKLHLYIPAYPGRAFWHTLGKLCRPEPGPVSVVLSMTRACGYRCPHCYQRRDAGRDLDMELLVSAARSMQDLGVSLFDIEGGEPLARFDRLIKLLRSLDDRAETWINTTGAGLTEARVDELLGAGLFGAMVSLHAPDAAAHDAFTGVPGSFETACRALRILGGRGACTAINCCPDPAMVESGGLERLLDLGRELGCAFVQVIHGKAAGGWLGRSADPGGGGPHLDRLCAMHREYNSSRKLLRHPSLSAQVFEEGRDLFGCTSGGVDRFYLGADGEVQPCEFLNVSFGNVRQESFETIFRRMRGHFAEPGSDWLCCTQAGFIARTIEEHGLERTPIPWEITRTFIDGWQRGEKTRLYRRLGIYRKRP